MVYKFGRFLQFAGLVILPIAVAGNIAERLSLRDSLILSAAGMLIFYCGWLLQRSGGSQ